MFEIYDLMPEKPFTLDTLAQAELNCDPLSVHMTPEQRDFYIRAALKIGAGEAARYSEQNPNALAIRLGAIVRDWGVKYPDVDVYAEYDAETHEILIHKQGVRRIAHLLRRNMRSVPQYANMNTAAKESIYQAACELLIAHELFHHLEATTLGPAHRMLPPMSLSFVGDFWKIKRYVKRTREIAAHSFAFTLLRIDERFPCTIEQTIRDRDRG